jgi:lipopolysaccharide/colanic/teichoic acid biosynthesis glycosyltransferase
MLKFRTMRIHAKTMKDKLQKYNEAPSPMFKMQNDPRFTKIGKLLSKTGIDEIPQLFHVLMGQMSIVGPRPLPIEEAEKLPKSWDFRYNVRPGILSDWAVAPDRYHSLKRWKELESQGLKRSSLKEELQLITNGLRFLTKSNIAFLFRRQKEPIKVNSRRVRPVIQRQTSQLSS